MIAAVQLVLGTALLSGVLSYAWWVKMRVWMLRQDLFLARGELWEAMLADGTLHDPGHRQLRNAINALIRVSPLISIFGLLRIIAEGAHRVQGINFEASPPKVREIHERIARRLFRYFFLETFLGLFVVGLALFVGFTILLPMAFVRSYLYRLVARVVDSSELIAFGKTTESVERLAA